MIVFWLKEKRGKSFKRKYMPTLKIMKLKMSELADNAAGMTKQ